MQMFNVGLRTSLKIDRPEPCRQEQVVGLAQQFRADHLVQVAEDGHQLINTIIINIR